MRADPDYMRPVLVEVDDTPRALPPDPDGRRIKQRFKELLDPQQLIPRLPVEPDELARLRLKQRRLVEELNAVGKDARRAGDSAAYERAKTEALLNGGPHPEQPLTEAEVQADKERVARDYRAAAAAILRWGRELVDTVASHPEWRDGIGAEARRHRKEADELRRRAEAADQRAREVEHAGRWLDSVAREQIYAGNRERPPASARVGPKLAFLDETGRAVG